MAVLPFWKRVGDLRAQIPTDPTFTVSYGEDLTGGLAGVVNEVSRDSAATMMARNIAKLASPEEIARFHRDQDLRDQLLAEAEFKNKQSVRIETTMPADMENIIARAVAAAVTASVTAQAPHNSTPRQKA